MRPAALPAVGWQVSGTYQYQNGAPLAFNTNTYFDASCDLQGLTSSIGKQTGRSVAGLDVPAWDVSCFYFHDAPVQTNGVDDPVKQRADQRIQMGNNVRYFPTTLPHMRTDDVLLLDVGISKRFTMPRDDLPDPHRNHQCLELHGAVNPRNATFGRVNQDRNNPRDIQVGARFTF